VEGANLVPYYNLAIERFAQIGFTSDAIKFYEEFKNLGLRPSAGTHWALFALWCSSTRETKKLIRWTRDLAQEASSNSSATSGTDLNRYFTLVLTELWRRREAHLLSRLFNLIVYYRIPLPRQAHVIAVKALCYLKAEKKLRGLLEIMKSKGMEIELDIWNEIFFMYASRHYTSEEKIESLLEEFRSTNLLPDVDTISSIVVLRARYDKDKAREVLEDYGLSDPSMAYVVANQGSDRLAPHGGLHRILNLLLKSYYFVEAYAKAWEIYERLYPYKDKSTYLWLVRLYAAEQRVSEMTGLLDELSRQSEYLTNAIYQQVLTELVLLGDSITAFSVYLHLKKEVPDKRLKKAFRPLVQQLSKEENLRSLSEILEKSSNPQETVEELVDIFISQFGDFQPFLHLLRRSGIQLSTPVAKKIIDELLRRKDIWLASQLQGAMLN
jgi:hypothetical protein